MTVEHLITLVVAAFASFRLARAVAVDTISDRFRSWVFKRAYPAVSSDYEGEIPEELYGPLFWRQFYGLVSCPHCIGWWISIVVWIILGHEYPNLILSAVATAGLQSALTSWSD